MACRGQSPLAQQAPRGRHPVLRLLQIAHAHLPIPGWRRRRHRPPSGRAGSRASSRAPRKRAHPRILAHAGPHKRPRSLPHARSRGLASRARPMLAWSAAGAVTHPILLANRRCRLSSGFSLPPTYWSPIQCSRHPCTLPAIRSARTVGRVRAQGAADLVRLVLDAVGKEAALRVHKLRHPAVEPSHEADQAPVQVHHPRRELVRCLRSERRRRRERPAAAASHGACYPVKPHRAISKMQQEGVFGENSDPKLRDRRACRHVPGRKRRVPLTAIIHTLCQARESGIFFEQDCELSAQGMRMSEHLD